mgnify:CR=1 FL=1|jgi:hypothetical protein|tara:strand:+ start:339 stop:500 length:162 start_codon:yes stop_codon:yes gene_type:complete
MSKSKGLGDTIKKVTSATKLDILAEKIAHKLGKDCGCNKRQEYLNIKFPYKGR